MVLHGLAQKRVALGVGFGMVFTGRHGRWAMTDSFLDISTFFRKWREKVLDSTMDLSHE
jgi:hypothetical protein